jgi:hypothetical protein
MSFSARFPGQCRRCNNPIATGEKIESASSGRGYQHASCPSYSDRAEINQQFGSLRAESAWNQDTDDAPEDPYSPHYYGKGGCVPGKCPLHSPRAAQPTVDADDASYNAWLAFQAMQAQVGAYVLADGSVAKVQMNRGHTNVYPQRWVVINGERLTEADTIERGEYRYIEDPLAREQLMTEIRTAARRMTGDEARAFAIRYGVCAVCGLSLKAAKSVQRGIGPVCWGRLDHSVEAPAAETPAAEAEEAATWMQSDTQVARTAAFDAQYALPKSTSVARAEKLLARKGFYTRSRWSRPGDDELEQAI